MVRWKTGCSGFYNRHWRGIFYPLDLPQKDWFSFYCSQLNSLELNVTFYRFPRKETFAKWYSQSSGGFMFSVKAPQLITHFKSFTECEKLLDDFYNACQLGLKQKLGCVLFQLPHRIKFSEEMLEKIVNNLNPDFKNVIEFRHESWWNEIVYEALVSRKIIFCNIDIPYIIRQPVINGSLFYMRLHGNPKMFYSSYAQDFMQSIINTVNSNKKIREAYIYFNNTAGDAGILNAVQFKKLAMA